MTRRLLLALMLLGAGCATRPSEPGLKALVGGRLDVSLDAEPIEYSVVVISQGKIRAAGPQATTPVPKGAETVSMKGKIIGPMPYSGKVATGEPADLMIRDAETFSVERLMRDGEWIQ